MFSKSSLIWSIVAQHSFPNYSITSILHSLLSFAFPAFLFVSIPIKPNPSSSKQLTKSLWPFTYSYSFLGTRSVRASCGVRPCTVM